MTLPGLHSFLEQGIPVAVGQKDVATVAKQSAVDAASIRALADGDFVEISDGPHKLMVLHTPGHTTGSICLHLTAEGNPPS